MDPNIQSYLDTIQTWGKSQPRLVADDVEAEVITVSETVAAAAAAYEKLRVALEYDEEHVLRRNAIHRFFKRRIHEAGPEVLAHELLRGLIWARYLPNKRVPVEIAQDITNVAEKYRKIFAALRQTSEHGQELFEWLLDVMATEIEYVIAPPHSKEALISLAYTKIAPWIEWKTNVIPEQERDMQVYLAVHRAVGKSDMPILRYRALTLYYPDWEEAKYADAVVEEVANQIESIYLEIERHLRHPGADPLFRLVRPQAFGFHLIHDIALDHPEAFAKSITQEDVDRFDAALFKAAQSRYDEFRTKLKRKVVRAVVFLFLTKMVLALSIEYPYEVFVLQHTDKTPLITNIVVHPIILGLIGLTVSIPEDKNSEQMKRYVHAALGWAKPPALVYKFTTGWKGSVVVLFYTLYAAAFALTVGGMSFGLYSLDFNWLSIVFFVFFLSLVLFFGLTIRNSRKEIVVVKDRGGIVGTIIDIMFLPIIRAGRWVALRAPKVNVFLFFLDFIVESPFKSAISVIEGWLAFLREKKDEI